MGEVGFSMVIILTVFFNCVNYHFNHPSNLSVWHGYFILILFARGLETYSVTFWQLRRKLGIESFQFPRRVEHIRSFDQESLVHLAFVKTDFMVLWEMSI